MANATVNGNCKEQSFLITAIGNPNVDIIVKVNDTYLFDKYNLSVDGHLPADAELLDKIKDDITKRKYEVIYTPGGCAQNTLRVLQWLINSPCKCVMIGSVGKDDEALYLEKEIAKCGVKSIYTKLNNHRTAAVIVITYQKSRSAVYGFAMGAASMYTVPLLLDNDEALSSIKNSKIVHLEAFFTVHSPDVGLEISRICVANDIITSFNLCGEYIIDKNKDAVLPYVDACDILIGNTIEFFTLCDALQIKRDDVKQAVKEVHKKMMNGVKKRENNAIKCMQDYVKILIITDGNNPLCCMTNHRGIIEYPIPYVDEHLIKDTTGAGDAFLGGFLYGILHEASILKCLELGCKIAAEIIQEHGCVLPNKNPALFTNIL